MMQSKMIVSPAKSYRTPSEYSGHLNILTSCTYGLCFDTDVRPRLDDLRNFPVNGGFKDITVEIGSEYESFGTLLLKDEGGSKVKNIEKEKRGHPVDITVEILRQWLQGKGREPVTWQTLVECLQDAQLNVLANIIESTLSQEKQPAGQPSQQPPGQPSKQPPGQPPGPPLCMLSFSHKDKKSRAV